MWLRLTERARKAVAFAQTDAKLSADLVVLASVREEGGLVARVLARMEVDADALREKLEGMEPEEGAVSDEVIEAAEQEARGLSSPYIGPEHLLLGVMSLGTSQAAGILRESGIELEPMRQALAAIMSEKQKDLL